MQRLNRHSLLSSINSLCDFLNENYKINQGGCCYIAYLIAKHLHKLGIKYNLVIFDSFRKDLSYVEYEVLKKHCNSNVKTSITGKFTCDHYCIQIIGAGVINMGRRDHSYNYTLSGIPYKNIKWIYDKGLWNNNYNIKHNNTIKNIVNHFFKEYEKTSNF